MVMMGMGNQDGNIEALHLVAVGEKIAHQLLAGGNNACTRIQKDGVIQDIHLDAGGVAPDFQRRWARYGNASPDPPEGNGKVVGHWLLQKLRINIAITNLLFRKKNQLAILPFRMDGGIFTLPS
jgi:hypothetical protein